LGELSEDVAEVGVSFGKKLFQNFAGTVIAFPLDLGAAYIFQVGKAR
jgi:hypothetical protein